MHALLKSVVAASLIALAPGLTSAKTVSLRIANELAPTEPINIVAREFAQAVNQRSDGRLNITVFPSSQLGTNNETYEQVRQGAPLIQVVDPGYLSDYVPDFGVLNGPYLLTDPAQFQKILDSDWFTQLKQHASDTGFHVLSFNYFFGRRHMLGDKPYPNAGALNGVTMRVQPNPLVVKTFQALGARGVALPWVEVYSALAQNVVSAVEAPLGSLVGAKLQEQRKVLTLTGHFTAFLGMAMNQKIFESLDPDLQKILTEESVKAGRRMTEMTIANDEKLLASLEEQGMTVVRDVDVDSYREATKKVYGEFPKWTPGSYDKIQAILKD
ncbi:Tripartite ATP-independent transporter DctP family solute receptor OS=Castellaniella defragrans OX=75697 GN=HNR28_003420 PE=3 SV=1 [Castellaniella defragrans]